MENMELTLDQMAVISGGKDEGGYAKKPGSKANCKIYQIEHNDTLTKIANRNNTTVAKIMAVNPELVDKNFIVTGCFIYIPLK